MRTKPSQTDDFELVNRESSENDTAFDLDEDDFGSSGQTTSASYSRQTGILGRASNLIRRLFHSSVSQRRRGAYRPVSSNGYRSKHRRLGWSVSGVLRPSRRCCLLLNALLSIIIALLVFTALFRPSYTHVPPHYKALREKTERSQDNGRANPRNEKVFIAASLFDPGGKLLDGPWADAVLGLLDMLGTTNVFLSIYESESDSAGHFAHSMFNNRVSCPHQLVYDTNFSMEDLPTVTLPDGSTRHKRMAFLAEMRNRALLPLREQAMTTTYDRLLFLNDVIFDPVEAAQLLFSTNQDESGRATYRAACAVDFINPFKFYDTFATRDLDGFSPGVPFYPWLTNAGSGDSRRDVLSQKDAVRVKSCWGGMVAFDATPFLPESISGKSPQKFRAVDELFWDASECCLIHSDLMLDSVSRDPQIFMNPYVRVAYDLRTLQWLHFTRRFERLYSVIHNLLNHMVGMPRFNPRRIEKPGEESIQPVWLPDAGVTEGGRFEEVERLPDGDGYCGIRMLQVMRVSPKPGERPWEMIPVPPMG